MIPLTVNVIMIAFIYLCTMKSAHLVELMLLYIIIARRVQVHFP